MNISDIAVLPIKKGMNPLARTLRKNAPAYIKQVIERTYATKEIKSLQDLSKEQISPLEGGALSAVYALKIHDYRVIKFRHGGIMAEAKALRAWRNKGADVVAVKHTGVVPGSAATGDPVKYIILDNVHDAHGNPSPTAYDLAKQYPERVRSFGKALGYELAVMHRAKSDRRFGEFADMWGKTAYKSWNSYLINYLKMHEEFLYSIGMSQELLRRVREEIEQIKFPAKGVYCHGDYSLRNAFVVSMRPTKVKIFDPNPLIGHPTWDVAILANNLEFSRRRYEKQPANKVYRQQFERDRDCYEGFLPVYEEISGRKISQRQLAPSQLMQMIFLLYIEYRKAIKRRKNPKEEIEVIIRREAIMAKVLEIVGEIKPRH